MIINILKSKIKILLKKLIIYNGLFYDGSIVVSIRPMKRDNIIILQRYLFVLLFSRVTQRIITIYHLFLRT